jgi:hypothetical protein
VQTDRRADSWYGGNWSCAPSSVPVRVASPGPPLGTAGRGAHTLTQFDSARNRIVRAQ